MKKRMFALILAISILASMVVLPTYAEDAAWENVTPVTDLCPCGCGKALAAIGWTAWAGEPKAGHYYLDGNYTQADTATVLSDTSVVIDLRGQTITTAEPSRLFVVNGFLHILDTVGGGRMMAKTPKELGGGIVLVEENEMIGPVFTLHSGTMTPDSGSQKANWGGLIGMGNGSTFRMYGGMLLNGHAETAYGGGAIGSKNNDNTNIEILGGKIVGCSSTKNGGSVYSTGTVKLENCEIIGGTAGYWGGNIFVSGENGKLTMKNVLVANGISKGTTTGNKYGGGNVIVYSSATATISDSIIRGGYAVTAGGNLCIGKGTTTVTNTVITGGSCGILGENVYGALPTAKVTFNGCTIDGGFHQGSSTITLKGAMKIGGTGLRLGTGTLTTTGLTSGAEVYVTGNKTFTGTAGYFKPAARTAITANGTSLTATLATDGALGYCPQCNKQVEWTAYGTGGSHNYLTGDVADFACVSVNEETALDLAGFDITAPGRAFVINNEASLLITDTAGQGSVTGSGVAGEAGGVFYNFGNLTLQGGTYTYAKNGVIDCGGIVASNGAVKISDAVLDAGAYNNTAETIKGGAVWMADGDTAQLTMVGCYVLGGKAYKGGGVWCGYMNVTDITDCIFLNGNAAHNGGNLGSYDGDDANAGTLHISRCRFEGGKATTYAGNVYPGRCTATLTDCYITGGEAKYGGNVNVSPSSQVNLENCIVEGGKADSHGGNMYSPGNSSKSSWTNCLVTNGSATTGGNICASNGKVDIIGGEYSYGTSTGNGGNLYAGSAKLTGLTVKADANGNVPLVCHGKAGSSGGNLYAKNIVTVTDAHIHNGTATLGGNDLMVNNTETTLTLGAGVIGNIRMNAAKALLTSDVYGGAVSNVTCNAQNATFVMDGYGDCGTILKGSTLYVATTSVVSKGVATWYVSNAEAVAACEGNSYIKLYTNNDLVLTKDLYVDLNGHTVAVSGNYQFYGMDASGDSYTEPSGAATGVTANTYDAIYAPNGNTYIAIAASGSVSYHRLGMKVTGVSIRTSASGMYYDAKWYCDDTLKGEIATYGVVTSTMDMPGIDFASEEENRYTVFAKDTFVSGETKKGAVITNIMKSEGRTAAENDKAGKTSIYAKAYLTFADGTTLVSSDRIQYSLYDVMKGLDSLIMSNPNKYRPFNTTVRAFYEKWKDNGMGSWKLNKIPTPADDGIIDVLMIGNSWCYYYVEELYALAEAAGVKMRVCNVYYSGCPVYNHYNWWKNGEANYQYYETYSDGRKFKGRDVSLEWCLAQREWDVITMNPGGKEGRTLTAEENIALYTGYVVEMFDYFKESFPNADFYFHQAWVFELGYVKSYASGDFRIDTVEDQIAYSQKHRQIVSAYVEAADIGRINTGDAWELYRAACAKLGIENNLCARLGNNGNLGDKSHDGDIGGGQYLNACVWFEILTGLDCRDTTYIPNYTYDGVEYPMSETMAQMLQDAAHRAASEIWPTYPENANG